jgi:hypothetical protein
MVIKFIDKFESIFYAVLFSNLTGHYLTPKNQDLGLFKDEPSIDIDNLNWREILEEHDLRYGKVHWLQRQEDLLKLKNTVESILKRKNSSKYKMIVNTIKRAIKFGPDYAFLNN